MMITVTVTIQQTGEEVGEFTVMSIGRHYELAVEQWKSKWVQARIQPTQDE